ncbi:MAG: hypothetical protein ACYCO9_21350 [Streptosporangiaceae bacterium]
MEAQKRGLALTATIRDVWRTPRLQIAGEALDFRAPGSEQADVVLLAPAGELAQIQGVRRPRAISLRYESAV